MYFSSLMESQLYFSLSLALLLAGLKELVARWVRVLAVLAAKGGICSHFKNSGDCKRDIVSWTNGSVDERRRS